MGDGGVEFGLSVGKGMDELAVEAAGEMRRRGRLLLANDSESTSGDENAPSDADDSAVIACSCN